MTFQPHLTSLSTHMGTIQLLVAASASWSTLCVGLVRGWSSPALPLMTSPNSTLPLTAEDQAWMASIPPLCALIGSLVVSLPMQFFGRRWTLAAISVPFTLGFVLMGLAHHVQSLAPLYVGRILTGLVCGASIPAAQIYVSECASPRIRGLLGSLTSAFLALGILASYVIGWLVDWPKLCFILASFPAVLALGMLLTPESPSWLVSKEKFTQAQQTLRRLRGPDADVEDEMNRMKQDLGKKDQKDGTLVPLVQRFSHWFSRPILLPMFISMALMFFQQFSGINAVIFYTVSIFNEAGSAVDRNVATIIVGIVQLLSTLVATFLVDRYGRRILLVHSGIGSGLSLTMMGLFFYLKESWGPEQATNSLGWLPLGSLIVFVIAYSVGLGPIPFIIMGEIFPSQHRTLLGPISSSFNLTCTFVVVRTFLQMTSSMGQFGVFWFYGACCFAGVVFVLVFLPETKGKTLEEIGNLFVSTGKIIDRRPSDA